jgi:hypothetical protein
VGGASVREGGPGRFETVRLEQRRGAQAVVERLPRVRAEFEGACTGNEGGARAVLEGACAGNEGGARALLECACAGNERGARAVLDRLASLAPWATSVRGPEGTGVNGRRVYRRAALVSGDPPNKPTDANKSKQKLLKPRGFREFSCTAGGCTVGQCSPLTLRGRCKTAVALILSGRGSCAPPARRPAGATPRAAGGDNTRLTGCRRPRRWRG